ncbi:hypothetical protein LBMAG50_03400 [Phycisphaerae bacterium]|nr:hypothetical protein LBMAG50_03400 [Phycisphaerae bacterium]
MIRLIGFASTLTSMLEREFQNPLGLKYCEEIQKIIAQCHFTVEPGYFVYAKVSELRDAGQHLLITRDGDEITVVTRSDQLAGLSIIATHKGKWKLLLIRSAVPFDCLGFLASISMAMADAQINITLVSTFTNDYVMVEEVNCDKATQILIQLGFRRRSELS